MTLNAFADHESDEDAQIGTMRVTEMKSYSRKGYERG